MKYPEPLATATGRETNLCKKLPSPSPLATLLSLVVAHPSWLCRAPQRALLFCMFRRHIWPTYSRAYTSKKFWGAVFKTELAFHRIPTALFWRSAARAAKLEALLASLEETK